MCSIKTVMAETGSEWAEDRLKDLDEDMIRIFIRSVTQEAGNVKDVDDKGRTALFYTNFTDCYTLLLKGANPLATDLEDKLPWEVNGDILASIFLRMETDALQKSGVKSLEPDQLKKYFTVRLTEVSIPEIIWGRVLNKSQEDFFRSV